MPALECHRHKHKMPAIRGALGRASLADMLTIRAAGRPAAYPGSPRPPGAYGNPQQQLQRPPGYPPQQVRPLTTRAGRCRLRRVLRLHAVSSARSGSSPCP